MKKKRIFISAISTAVDCAGVIAMAGCGLFGNNVEIVTDYNQWKKYIFSYLMIICVYIYKKE